MITQREHKPTPRWAFVLWCSGAGDLYCAYDDELPFAFGQRTLWKIRGHILQGLFSWWWYQEIEVDASEVPF
jgi:hypothetical protein